MMKREKCDCKVVKDGICVRCLKKIKILGENYDRRREDGSSSVVISEGDKQTAICLGKDAARHVAVLLLKHIGEAEGVA